jgi:hypothetical protein
MVEDMKNAGHSAFLCRLCLTPRQLPCRIDHAQAPVLPRKPDFMIDHFALALGHGLMAYAMMRLVLRAGLDDDPLIGDIQAQMDDSRQAMSAAGRNAARRAPAGEPAVAAGDAAPAGKTER